MKTSVTYLAAIILFSGIFQSCSEKDDNPSAKPKEIIAWEKPIDLRNEITSINSLTMRLDTDLAVKYTTWVDFSTYPYPSMKMHINLMKDGSFAYLYSNNTGYVIVKTIPL